MHPTQKASRQKYLRQGRHNKNTDKQSTKLMCALTMCMFLSISACSAREIVQIAPRVAEVTTKIKAALISEPQIDAAAILIEQVDNIITLSGFVDSHENKTTAVKIAKQVSQLRVVDKLEVRK